MPREDPSGESIVLPRGEYERIKQASKVMSKEEREAKLAAIKEEKEYQEVCSTLSSTSGSFVFVCNCDS